MSITIDINPSLEAVLKERAKMAGISIEDYLLRLAEMDAAPTLPIDPVFDESMRRLEAFRGKLGSVPEGAFDPEALYGDR